MQKVKATKNFSNSFLDFEFELRSTKSLRELVKVLSSGLDKFFQVQETCILVGKKIGGKFLVEQEITPFKTGLSENLSELSERVKKNIELFFCSENDFEGHICEIDNTKYKIELLFRNKNTIHILYHRAPVLKEFYSDINAVVSLFSHEWNWHQRLEEAHELIFKDDLTGLYNYRYFESILDQEIARSSRFNDKFSLMFIDLDNFKSVNDSYGHLTGSELLKKVAKEILNAVREIDYVIRYGGDEFVVVLLGTQLNQAYHVAERVRKFIEKYEMDVVGINDVGEKVSVTASVGLSCFPDHGSSKEDLLYIADSNMYSSKEAGKNRVNFSGQKLNAYKI